MKGWNDKRSQTPLNAHHSLGITSGQLIQALSAIVHMSGKTGPMHSFIGRQINKTASKTNQWRGSFIPLEWGLFTGVLLSVERRGAPLREDPHPLVPNTARRTKKLLEGWLDNSGLSVWHRMVIPPSCWLWKAAAILHEWPDLVSWRPKGEHSTLIELLWPVFFFFLSNFFVLSLRRYIWIMTKITKPETAPHWIECQLQIGRLRSARSNHLRCNTCNYHLFITMTTAEKVAQNI